jgi:hypothetical protein
MIAAQCDHVQSVVEAAVGSARRALDLPASPTGWAEVARRRTWISGPSRSGGSYNPFVVSQVQDPEQLHAELLARVEQAHDPYDRAVWQLLIGEADAGLATVREWLRDQARGTPASLRLAQMALLADDPGAPTIAAAAIEETVARFVPGDREFHATLLALIAADEDLAHEQLARLDLYTATHDKLSGGRPSRSADIARGLLARDATRLAVGVEALLAWHLRRARVRSDVFNSSRGVISLDAIVAIILGHRIGFSVAVEARYRAAQLPLLALHLSEWQGRPLPRGLPIIVTTDLVAAPWLRVHGIHIETLPPATAGPSPAKRSSSIPTASPPDEQARAREALQARTRLGGHPWQLASWAVMLGDVAAARAHIEAAAADARRRWQSGHPTPMSNPNIVREHFAFALTLGDEGGLRESVPALQAWLRTQEGRSSGIYAHAAGYLDLLCDLVGGGDRARPSRAAAEQVSGPLSSVRVAAIALVERDAALFREGLESMLTEHARTLERRSSPPPPICATAVHLAAAASRLGVPVEVEERFAAWPVPVERARIPCDLLGRPIRSRRLG